MTRATAGWRPAPKGSSMISRSENRLTRNGSTDARSSGPPRLNRTMAVGAVGGRIRTSHGAGERGAPFVRRQVGVEHHRDIADEKSAARSDRQRVAADLDEPVGQEPAV